jgi:GH15 family glucan-1,4-alpha-glucosidase
MSEDITFKQFYWPETNILVTRFLSTHGIAQITDYLPSGRAEGETGYGWVVRHLHVVWGNMTFALDCTPAFNFARDDHTVQFCETGAIVAAPTTSLPETLGGPRNWDYRYTWIRDAAFTVYAFLRIGFTEEAKAFMHFLEARLLFEQMLGYGNHLGLYAEKTGSNGEALGNFPQAFTHFVLISAAFKLDHALGSQA